MVLARHSAFTPQDFQKMMGLTVGFDSFFDRFFDMAGRQIICKNAERQKDEGRVGSGLLLFDICSYSYVIGLAAG